MRIYILGSCKVIHIPLALGSNHRPGFRPYTLRVPRIIAVTLARVASEHRELCYTMLC